MSRDLLDQPDETPCECLAGNFSALLQVGDAYVDDQFAEVSVQICSRCGQLWLRYFYENEAFTRSGRWYLAPLPPHEYTKLRREDAKKWLENMPWYYCGGSYFDGKVSKTSGRIYL
ncbi:MAG: hypothetical protein SFY66_07310 [Oculatellaceae cyanobacterium bins.114]|nr:hypothetical protein [Oculatellaceae cyanobacterium bins.114]